MAQAMQQAKPQQATNQPGTMPQQKPVKKKSSKWLWILIVLAVIVIGVGVWFWIN